MVKTVGVAEITANTTHKKPAILFLIAGCNGVGKSSLAIKIAEKYQVKRNISTCSIREIIRTFSENRNNNLERSSFSKGQSMDPVLDWDAACKPIENGILATIERARREGVSLILEGEHLNPSDRLLRTWKEGGGIALGIVMSVADMNQHERFLKEREKNTYRSAHRYIAGLNRMHAIQDHLIERVKVTSWKHLDITRVQDEMERVAHWVDLAWNEAKKN
ncbi:MAG TPA: hypothetical protein D7H86_04570 [Candidatus Poseidoniales archaeon]|nr:hypothetical protein [Euryarchaeota archaeon]DAC13432.1 MAG TPA: hypothetical protein D7H86_04570 [Candidatus Poseidoniales archaeon]|tara:strand:+ start:198 stop:857 length:660 start_codon:yes stop_codon:yes gene_type:complete